MYVCVYLCAKTVVAIVQGASVPAMLAARKTMIHACMLLCLLFKTIHRSTHISFEFSLRC